MPPRSPIREFVDTQQVLGRFWFRKSEIPANEFIGDSTVRVALHRLERERRVVRLWRDFYVVVPAEYSLFGAPPVLWFVDPMMQAMGRPYYVGLLTAVEIHRSMTTSGSFRDAVWKTRAVQVVTDVAMPSIDSGGLSIRFFSKSGAASASTRRVDGPRGPIQVSTPLCTAIDLLANVASVGGVTTIQPVVRELVGLSSIEEGHKELSVCAVRELESVLDLSRQIDPRLETEILRTLRESSASRNPARAQSEGPRRETLSECIRRAPDDIFWKELPSASRVPDYNRIFVWYVRQYYDGSPPPIEVLLRDLEQGRVLNLTTFQRVVATERKARDRLFPESRMSTTSLPGESLPEEDQD